MLYAAFVRSPYAHARIARIELGRAKAHPGVFGAFTGADLAKSGVGSLPVAHKMTALLEPFRRIPRSTSEDEARAYVGDEAGRGRRPRRSYAARDVAELVAVEYEQLDPAIDLVRASEGVPYVHAGLGTNVAFRMPYSKGPVDESFKAADQVVEMRFVNQRLAPVPVEPRGMVAAVEFPGRRPRLDPASSTQIPHLLRTQLSLVLGLAENRVRVIAPEVLGGGFGAKPSSTSTPRRSSISWLARTARAAGEVHRDALSECFQAMIHGRDQIDDARARR